HIARVYRRQFQFILVDEYQDTNKIQADFIDLLAREHQNVMVVGDDAQSIYSWRGANFQNILEFPIRYPKAQVFRIELNYRSVPYQNTSRIRCFEQDHIKDVASFILVVVNPHDEVACRRMARLLPGIGSKSTENLWKGWEREFAASPLPVTAVADPGPRTTTP